MNDYTTAFSSLRHRLGKTQTEMAASLGLKLRGYQYIEAGERQPSGSVLKLAGIMAGKPLEPRISVDVDGTEYAGTVAELKATAKALKGGALRHVSESISEALKGVS